MSAFVHKFSSSCPMTMLHPLSPLSYALYKSLILRLTAIFAYCCHPHHRWQLSSSFIVLGLKTWQASGLLGQYNKSDCGGVLSSILQHLFGNSSPSEILLLSSWRLVEEIAGLVRVDGITSTFTAACRTLSFHVVFNGSGYATCRWFSVK